MRKRMFQEKMGVMCVAVWMFLFFLCVTGKSVQAASYKNAISLNGNWIDGNCTAEDDGDYLDVCEVVVYKDTQDETEEKDTLNNPRIGSDGTVTWDCVYFGNYPQSDASGQTKDPIKWRVLSVNEKDAFLIADQILDVQQYNIKNMPITWEQCTLRSWLNGYAASDNSCGMDYTTNNFIDNAFTTEEQGAILVTSVVNDDNRYGIAGGNDTEDKIFLLSYDEVTNPDYGFPEDDSKEEYEPRIRTLTPYVEAGGSRGEAYTSDDENGRDGWWLRTPGFNSNIVLYVDYYGDASYTGDFVNYYYTAVCPVLHLDLSSANLWSYAGTVSCWSGAVKPECSHPNTEITGAINASCTEEGYTGDAYCKDCKNKIKEGESIPAKGHQWNEGVITKEPGSSEDGIKTFTCTVCGEIKREVVKATGENTKDNPKDNSSLEPDNSPDKEVQVQSDKPVAGTTIADEKSKAVYKVISTENNKGEVEYIKPSNTKEKNVVIPKTITIDGNVYQVTSIAKNAFRKNTILEKVVVGDNVAVIGNSAFEGCSKLKVVTIKNNVTSIGDKAFYKCTKLSKIIIPSRINKIGKQAFYGCKKLKTITIKTKKLTSKSIGKKAFKGIDSKATIKVPKSKLKDYKKILKAKGAGSKTKIK